MHGWGCSLVLMAKPRRAPCVLSGPFFTLPPLPLPYSTLLPVVDKIRDQNVFEIAQQRARGLTDPREESSFKGRVHHHLKKERSLIQGKLVPRRQVCQSKQLNFQGLRREESFIDLNYITLYFESGLRPLRLMHVHGKFLCLEKRKKKVLF